MLALALALHLSLAAADAPADALPVPEAATENAVPAVADASAGALPAAGAPGLALPARADASPASALTATPGTSTASLSPGAPRLAAMTLAPRELDPGPFRAGEMAGATLGAFAGDAMVLGAGYVALQMFANGQIAPTANNFRHAIYGLGVSALVLPPLSAVLMAKLTGAHGSGTFLKAMLLATAGEVVALAAGYYFAPRFWVVLPVQAIAVSIGASYGLHWGRGSAADPPEAEPDARRQPEPKPGATAWIGVPLCPDS